MLDILGINWEQAIVRYGDDLGDKIARLTVFINTEIVELWPASDQGPAEDTTSGYLSVEESGTDDGRAFIRICCQALISGDDPPDLPPLAKWIHRVS